MVQRSSHFSDSLPFNIPCSSVELLTDGLNLVTSVSAGVSVIFFVRSRRGRRCEKDGQTALAIVSIHIVFRNGHKHVISVQSQIFKERRCRRRGGRSFEMIVLIP